MTRPTRVLIVDDEESVRTFAERALRIAGYETAVAADGLKALRIATDQGPFDLLLADVVMPSMPGNELARCLRLLDPKLKVLYFTGYRERLFIETMTLRENEALIEKPVSMKGLLEAVSLLLFGRAQRLEHGIVADKARRRSVRVSTGPLQVRIAGILGRLVNVSATGALVRAQHNLHPERETPLRIDVGSEPVELRGRVVRSHAVSIPLPGATWRHQEYAVALAFTQLPPIAKEALRTLCGDRFSEQE